MASLAGNYVMVYESLTTSVSGGGGVVTIAPVEGTDSISITNFWDNGVVVKAKVATDGTITIPNQVIGNNADYGDYDLAFCTSNGKPDRDTQLTGYIGDDGLLYIDSWWGVFVMSGQYADQFFCANYATSFEKTNATMSYKRWDSTNNVYKTGKFGVVVSQPSVNVVKVKNFANFGRTVEILLNRDSTATIANQVARLDATNGDWSTVSTTYKDDMSGLAAYDPTITCAKAADKRTISWGNWSLLCTKYYLGMFTEGKIETTTDLAYPSLSVTDFEGEGTEANPYKITTLDDLILLSDKVNGSTELIYGDNAKYARVFMGKYFRMENDIDMAGYRFEPIGHSWYYHFAGTFDGNGKTIKGLTVNTGANGYAGLFGKCDTISVIKNLKIENPDVYTEGYYAGAVAAMSLGTIDNCDVTGGTITNMGKSCPAGVAGVAHFINNCTVNGTRIVAYGGYAGGVAGEVGGIISNCNATNVTIVAGGPYGSEPSGGVVAQLWKAKANNCYFAGTLDGSRTPDLVLGGVVGVCYKGEVDKCFNAGNVLGYSSGAAVGGVVGSLQGSLTNSYSTGRVYGYSSRKSGGITGWLRSYTNDEGVVVEPTVKNCYTAGTLAAETYQYNTETELRETIGTIDDGVNPVLENLYYDKQMVDFKSAKFGAFTKDLVSAQGPAGFDAAEWVFTEGLYPRLKGLSENEAACFGATAFIMNEYSSLDKVARDFEIGATEKTEIFYLNANGEPTETGHFSKIEGDSVKLGDEFGTDTIFVASAGIGSRYYLIKVSPVPFDGAGTVESPYQIKTAADLVKLSEVTNGVKQYFPDSYFKMMNDIDMSSVPGFKGICSEAGDAHNQFAGHFDGGGFAIHNLKYTQVMAWKTEPTEDTFGTPETGGCSAYQGFIGRLGAEGSLKNLTIAADCDFSEMWATSAPVVGYNYGLIENCKNYADITGHSCWIGGIVGQNTKTGVVRNCYNEGDITSGYMDAGGITGTNNGLVENCLNVGNIEIMRISNFLDSDEAYKNKFAGGITGGLTGGRIANSVNMGNVMANGRVGGISGSIEAATAASYAYHNDVLNCITYGSVFAEDKLYVGALGGSQGTQGEVADNYYDGQITIHKANGNASMEGTTAASTATLTSGVALENFSTDLWSFEAGVYPVLKQFANEPRVKLARKVYAKVAEGETMAELKTDVVLDSSMDWQLRNGSKFAVKNSKLVLPVVDKAVITDTLYATTEDGFIRVYTVQVLPVIPVAGAGTKDSPYIISNADEWIGVADYIASTGISMEDKFVKLTADIDMSTVDAIYKPMAYDRVTPFNGDFDGGNHTLKGFAVEADDSYFGGAFAIVGEKAHVHDLNVEGKVNSAETYAGGVVGELYGKLTNVKATVEVTSTKSYASGVVGKVFSGAELTNVVNKGEITSSATYASGITGYSEQGVKYVNCGNEGKILYTGTTANSYASGLIGTCYPDTLIGCYNTGSVAVTNAAKAGGLSGLVGMANSAKEAPKYYFENCYNTASISSLANNAGLVLTVNSSGYTRMHMKGCYNTGDISSTSTATKSSTYTAGIAGLYCAGSTYEDCWNSGTILSQKPVYAGGLFCYYKGSFSVDSMRTEFKRCYNTGSIIASGNQGGGIVAYATNNVGLDSCYNTGNIEGGFGLGGIVANLSGAKSSMTNCYNIGDVTTSTNRAGGLIGYSSGKSTVSNCFNFGDIASTDTSAKTGYGIGGLAGQGSSDFSDVFSVGDVSGAARVGGLIGYPAKNNTCIKNAYFFGAVTAPADTCGMIIGINMIDNGKNWTAENTIENVYYIKDAKFNAEGETIGVDTAGVALSVAEMCELNLGNKWSRYDRYSLPVLADYAELDAVKLAAAMVVLADGDTYSNVTDGFYVGTPAGVVWTASNGNVKIVGNNGEFPAPYDGNVELTATCGEFSKSIDLVCKVLTGVNGIADDGKTVVKEEFYNAAGAKVAEPEAGTKAVYVVVKHYDDGTKAVVKEVR